MHDTDDLDAMIATQRRHLLAASAVESDLDLTFRLQIEEALAASLALQPSSSAALPPADFVSDDGDGEGDSLSRLIAIQTLELDRFRQEKQDTTQSRTEHRRLAEDLRRHEHDEQFARELLSVPNKDGALYGDKIQWPMDVDKDNQGLLFRLYFKGMTSREPLADGTSIVLSAVGAAVCDPNDNLLLKIQKPLPEAESCRELLEAKALVECLNAAISLGIKKVHAVTQGKDEQTTPVRNIFTSRWVVDDDYLEDDEPAARKLKRERREDADLQDTQAEDGNSRAETPESQETIESGHPRGRSVNMMQGCRDVDEFEKLDKIGGGTYGVVYKARDKKTGEIVALKKVKMEKEHEGFPVTALREINIFKEVVVGNSLDCIFIVMEYLDHDLKSLSEAVKQPFSLGEVKCLMQQLLQGATNTEISIPAALNRSAGAQVMEFWREEMWQYVGPGYGLLWEDLARAGGRQLVAHSVEVSRGGWGWGLGGKYFGGR